MIKLKTLCVWDAAILLSVNCFKMKGHTSKSWFTMGAAFKRKNLLSKESKLFPFQDSKNYTAAVDSIIKMMAKP